MAHFVRLSWGAKSITDAARTNKHYCYCWLLNPQALFQVTLIHNLEVYGIDVEEFACVVQIGAACSTSITDMPGKNKGKEVQVQGNQIHYLEQLLTGKCILLCIILSHTVFPRLDALHVLDASARFDTRSSGHNTF